jgi:hypothetical protein
MIFNGSKKVLLDHHFFFGGEEIEITSTYTYLGVELLGIVSLLHRIRSFVDSTKGQDRYSYLAYCSSESIALSSPYCRTWCWFVGVSDLLEFASISMDQLLPSRYLLDVLGHLLPTR